MNRCVRKFMSWQAVKTIFDFTLSLLALVVLSPLLLIVSAAIKFDSEGPVLFVQDRVGLNGKIFKIYKFRSMLNNAQDGFGPSGRVLTQADNRITKLGKFLRGSSIDEIPQLWNVVRGEMALIGPRPVLPVQAEQFSDFQRERLRVKPGLTGLVAVRGGYELSWPQRIRLDVWYVRHQSFALDCYIFFKTIELLIAGRSIYNSQGVSEDFKPAK